MKTVLSIRLVLVLLSSAVLVWAAGGCSPRNSKPQTAEQSSQHAASKDSPAGSAKDSAQNRNSHSEAVPDGSVEEPKIEYTQEGVTLRLDDNGRLRMIATAREVSGDEVTRQAVLLDFSAELYENGKLTTVVTAARGLVDIPQQTLTASGGVTVKSLDRGTVIKAAWVRWYAKEEKVIGKGGVKIDSEMGTVEAVAFTADTALKTFTVKDSAKGLEP